MKTITLATKCLVDCVTKKPITYRAPNTPQARKKRRHIRMLAEASAMYLQKAFVKGN